MAMFKNLWLDRTKNQMHLWTTDGAYNIYDFKCKSYELWPELQNATMRTVEGIPVRPVFDTSIEERNKISNNIRNSESDIQPEIRFLADYYKDVDNLKFKFEDFNICYFDIEIDIDKGFPHPSEAARPVNLITAYGSKSNKFVTFGLEKELIEHIYLTEEDIQNGTFPDGHEEIKEAGPDGVIVKTIKYYVKREKKITFDSPTAKELGYENSHEYVRCETEEELLKNFFNYFESERFDSVSGWNSSTFDIPYLVKRCENLGLQHHRKFSPVRRVYLVEKRNDYNRVDLVPVIAGLSVLDMLTTYKKSNLKQQENNKENNRPLA